MTRTLNLIAKAGGLLFLGFVVTAVAVECANWRHLREGW